MSLVALLLAEVTVKQMVGLGAFCILAWAVTAIIGMTLEDVRDMHDKYDREAQISDMRKVIGFCSVVIVGCIAVLVWCVR